jgi:glycosyltransferase involved in cell wall biosynthesis
VSWTAFSLYVQVVRDGAEPYDEAVRVCVLATALDIFKGGNHLPLFAALPSIQFTILTHRAKFDPLTLPINVHVETLPGGGGSYYFGIADRRFARAVLVAYPPTHEFWQAFDVIHLNQTLHPSLLALATTGRPLLYAVHHPVTVDREVAIRESSLLLGLLWRLKYAPLVRWQRVCTLRAPAVMTVSRTVVERLERDYGCAAEKISIVPNGVDGVEFAPSSDATAEFDVIAVGSLIHPRKGFRYLLEAYRALVRQGLKIADVGRRSPAQCSLLARVPGVRVFGTVDQATITALLQRSAVLISTSLYEGFGLSLIEALACGRPAFAFDGGAVHEVLDPIDPMLVVPLGDTEALVQHVRAFLACPLSERDARGRRYREEVLQRYPLAHSASVLHSIYEGLQK